MKAKGFGDILELAKDHLTCIVCLENPTAPVLLTCCGRICCQRCIDTWLGSNTTCPYCRANLLNVAEKYIAIPWAEVLPTILNLYSNQIDEKLMCKTHSKLYEYKCTTCNEFLCSDCLFSMMSDPESKHKNHKIVKLSDLLLETKKAIQARLSDLLDILGYIKNQGLRLSEMSEDLKEQKKNYDSTMIEQYNDLNNKVKEAFEKKRKLIDIQTKARVAAAVEKSIRVSNEIYKKGSIQQITKQVAVMKEVNEKAQKAIVSEDDLRIDNPLLPEFHTFEISIPDFVEKVKLFSKRGENDVRYLFSEPQNIAGNKWRAKIYPNGNSNGINTHLSLFVELIKGPQEQVTYQYKVEVIPATKTGQIIWKSFSSEFVQNDSWGWNKVALLSVITTPDYIRPDGSLLLTLSVRATSRHQETNDIKYRTNILSQKIKELKQSLASEVLPEDLV